MTAFTKFIINNKMEYLFSYSDFGTYLAINETAAVSNSSGRDAR